MIPPETETFDAIVVGAGSAGAAFAARLSEDPARRVLLLEAGRDLRSGDTPPEIASANPLRVILPPELQAVWQWPGLLCRRTAVQKPRLYWRGRGMGGSSTVNAQIAIRGVAEAFDLWARSGCTGWSAADVLPWFAKLESDALHGNAPHHGSTGPVPVHRAPREAWGAVDRALADAALALGHPWNDDLNAPHSTGVAQYPINSRGARRVSSNDAYLEPARARPNLAVVAGALVDRVVFEGAQACGVEAIVGGERRLFRGRGVALSAGAVHSPAILMRSGIGDPATLSRFGIAVRAASPGVGRNFMDHPIVRAELRLAPALRPRDVDFRHTNVCVAWSSGIEGGGRNDMLYIAFNHRGFEHDDPARASPGGVSVSVFEAFSRGEIVLRSADPRVDPFVEANMLSDQRDLARLRLGVRRLAALLDHPAAASIAEPAVLPLTATPLAAARRMDDAALDAVLLAEASDAQHAAGTCRMGAADDAGTVLDLQCRVRGVEGLRVVDASAMPADCRANTHLTTTMIAEKIAGELRGRPL